MSLSSEWQVVLSCARAALRGDERLRLPDLSSVRVDWRRTAAIACQNRVGPLVYSALRRMPPPPASERALKVLNQAYVATAARNAALFGALETVVDTFSVEQIPLIVLKGAALAQTVYPDRALRPMSDIDLLICEEDLASAERALRSVGYEVALPPEMKEELRVRHHHWLFRSTRPRTGGVPVELHWKLDPPGGPVDWDIDALFERATPLTRARAMMLGPEDSLLHLCLHLCRHRFNGGVIALCDIAGVIAKYKERLDWAKLQTLAGELVAAEHLGVCLRLAYELMGADVPADLLGTGAEPVETGRTVELARERLLEEKGDVRGAAELKLRWRRRGFGGRVAAARRAFAPESGGAAPGPGGSMQPAYLARVQSLVRSYGPWLWALLRHPRMVSGVAEREERKFDLDSWCSAREVPRQGR